MPYFETVKSFADVQFTNEGVDTCSFLEASDGLVKLFGERRRTHRRTEDLGVDTVPSTQTSLVLESLASFRQILEGVRARYEAVSDKSGTLESLVLSEGMEVHKHATPCLVRLIRGLAFTCKALQIMQNDTSSELHTCFKRSYDEVLRHHHTFFIRSVVSVAIRAVPGRDDFLTRIAQGGSIEKLNTELSKWLEGLERIVKHVSSFLDGGGHGKV